jgi:hypothetical protein
MAQLWKWDKERVMRLMRATIHTGRYPAVCQWAHVVVICKPGKEDYVKLKAYHSISQFS